MMHTAFPLLMTFLLLTSTQSEYLPMAETAGCNFRSIIQAISYRIFDGVFCKRAYYIPYSIAETMAS